MNRSQTRPVTTPFHPDYTPAVNVWRGVAAFPTGRFDIHRHSGLRRNPSVSSGFRRKAGMWGLWLNHPTKKKRYCPARTTASRWGIKKPAGTVIQRTGTAYGRAAQGYTGNNRQSAVSGGAGGNRTRYLFNAIEALSQMSYSPTGRLPEAGKAAGAPLF